MRYLTILFFISYLFSTGKYGDAFLNLGTSARNLGLGQAVIADMGNPTGFYISPASISSIKNRVFSLLVVNQFNLAEYSSISIATPLKNQQYVSFNFSGLIVDDIQVRPDLGLIGSLEARRDSIRNLFNNGYEVFEDLEISFTSIYSKLYNGEINLGLNYLPFEAPIGANIKMIKKELNNRDAVGIGIDIGGMFSFSLSDVFSFWNLGRFSAGMSINNIAGTHLIWSNNLKDVIPMQFLYGFSYDHPIKIIDTNILFLTQQNNLFPNQLQYGMELKIRKKLYIRLGNYANTYQGGIGFMTKFKKVKELRLDYGFGDHELGGAHRIGMELQF